ncbi:MAG: choline transporter-like family protein [Candidatus Komeilibacteria bacterium]|nr:choline transporter-like family protein [Candidatus Komeilibacteria bacterium]
MESLYRPIIKKAWDYLKEYKFLWLLGLFASLWGAAAEYNALFTQYDRLRRQPELFASFQFSLEFVGDFFRSLGEQSALNVFSIILILLFFLLIILVLAWLATIGQAGLTRAAEKLEKGRKIGLRELMVDGAHYFWPVLGLNVLAKAIIFILLTALVTPLLVVLMAQNSGWAIFLAFATLIIFVPIAIIITFVTKYAIAYTVVKGQSFWESFGHGWRLFTRNWLISLEMALIVLILNVALAFILGIFSLLLMAPILLVGLASSGAGAFYFFIVLVIVVTAIIFLVATAIFSAWQNLAWTLLFLKICEGVSLPKIIRWIAGKLNR